MKAEAQRVNAKYVVVGDRAFAPVFVEIPPREVMPFSALFEKLSTAKIYSERGFFHAGRVYQAQGNVAKAREQFQKAVEKAKAEKIDWFAQDVEARIGLLDLEQ